jgi:hypothetical protein
MFIPAYVLQWRGSFPEKRVRDNVHGDHYTLNTNRMYEITENADGDPTMRFFDNPANSRDGGARMVITDETIGSIIAYADTTLAHNTYTLDVFPNNDPTETTYELTISKASIAYLWDHGASDSSYTWLVYALDGWDMAKVLVDKAYSALWQDLLEMN